MNSKIPGVLAPPPKTEIDGKIENLNLKTLPELQELLQRQEKLLKNKAFVSKLQDRGEKIQTLYDRIQREIVAKGESKVDEASNLLANLNVNDMEWDRNRKTNKNQTALDSDDDSDEEDPLKVIAQSTHQVKTVIMLPKSETLITVADLESDDSTIDGHAKYICGKTGKGNVKSSFKPYKTTISDVHEPSKEKLRPKGKHWEVTAATPPPISHEPMKVLSLEQSLALQKQYTQHMKDIKSKHATEKLASQLGFKIGDVPKPLLDYRDHSDSESEASETHKAEHHSDEEVFDDEDADKGDVVFTIMK